MMVLFLEPIFAGEETKTVVPETKEAQEIAALCQKTYCRPPLIIKLHKEDGSMFESSTVTPLPVVQGGSLVSIFPGEVIYLEAEEWDTGLKNIRVVEKIADPKRTMTLKFEQTGPDRSGKYLMLLKINNPFSKSIKYHAGLMHIDNDNIFKTSSCPIMPGQTSYESWPYPVFQLVLNDFKWTEEKNNRCEW